MPHEMMDDGGAAELDDAIARCENVLTQLEPMQWSLRTVRSVPATVLYDITATISRVRELQATLERLQGE